MAGYVDAVHAVHVVEQLRGLKDQPSIGHTYCTGKLGETSSRKDLVREVFILWYSITSSEVDTFA